MGDRFKLQGDTDSAKLSHVETILRRVLRRPPSSLTVATPPIVVMHYVENVGESGLVGRWIMPAKGVVSKLLLFVGQTAEKAKPTLSVMMKTGGKTSIVECEYRVGTTTMQVGLSVEAGSLVEVNTTIPEAVFGLSVGIYIEVSLDSMTKEKLLLEACDAGEEEGREAE